MSSLLVRVLGFPATLIHGDTLVLDRWLLLRKHVPVVPEGSKKLLDVGCGSGAFTVGAAKRGYSALGLTWDERDQGVARERASICNAKHADFEVCDVRKLDTRPDLHNGFEVIVCCENIEHIMDDQKLMVDMAKCLKPGGDLVLTTPNVNYIAITPEDNGPFSKTEDGWHVRRGYSEQDIRRLCQAANLQVVEIGYCSGFTSQKITALMRIVSKKNKLLGWALVFPLRVIPPLVDMIVKQLTKWPDYSITLVARRA